MYKLYYLPGTCSLAVHAMLNELGQDVELIKATDVANYKETINPTGSVPVLDDNGTILREGAAIMLHLLEKHDNNMLPKSGAERTNALQWLMIANATVHPAYSRMFFASRAIEDDAAKKQTIEAAAKNVESLWAGIDKQLSKTAYVCGDKPTAADFMLTTYANWGQFFDVEIKLGDNVKRMLKNISALPSYQKALATEQVEYKAAA